MDRQNQADDRGLVVQAVAAGLFMVALAVIPSTLGLVGPFAALGPSATAVAWLPALFYLLGALLPLAARATGRSLGTTVNRLESAFGLLARASIVLLVARSLTDPTGRSLLQQLFGVARSTVGPLLFQLGTWLVLALALIACLPVVVWFLAELVTSKPTSSSGTSRGESLAQQSAKWLQSKAIRVTWALFPIALRAGLKLLAAVAYVCVAGLVWVVYGIVGLRLLTTSVKATGSNSFSGQLVGVAAMFRAAITANATFGGVFTRRVADAYRDVVSITRVGGKVTGQQAWRLANDASSALKELHEFTYAVVIAYDTALNATGGRAQQGPSLGPDSPGSPGMPRPAAPRYAGYEITVSRAWSTNAYHAIVVHVSPPSAAEDAAKLTSARLIPLIDPHSSWATSDLTSGLLLSDPRVRTDEHREGQTGLFITLDRIAEPQEVDESATGGDKVVEAVRHGLIEKRQPTNMFRLIGPPERSFDKLTYRFQTGNWTQTQAAGQIAARMELIETWKSLRDAIRVFAGYREEDIGLWHDDRSREFVITLRVEPPPFPGDKPGDDRVLLLPFLRQNATAMRRTDPRRFCVGLDFKGDPIWASLGITPHILVAGTSGAGKSVSGVIGPMEQLAYINPPSDFGLWIVDTKHEAHLYFDTLPHTRQIFTPNGIEDVLPYLQEFDAEALRRRHAYAGQDWHPGIGDPFLVLVIEEWFQLIENARSRDVGKEIKQVESTIKAINAIARSVGCHVILATQDPRSETLPTSLSDLLPLKLVTYGVSEPMLRQIFGNDMNPAIARVPKGKRGRLAVDGVEDIEGVTQVQALWSHDSAHKPPTDIKALIAEVIARWGPRTTPVQERQPKPQEFDPFVDTTPDGDDDQESDDDWADLENAAPARVSQAVAVGHDEAIPPIPAASDFAPSADAMTFARGVLRLAYRYNAGRDRWQPISQSRVDELIRAVPGRDTSVRIERVSQALRLLTDAGVLVPVATSLRGERQLHILNWREAEELL